jgi:choline-sulfatase
MNGNGMTRRELMAAATGAVALPFLNNSAEAASPPPAKSSGLRMNLVIFMTDQERKIQHFPVGWEEQNLPGLTRLKKNGLTFENAFTNACMCSPARATIQTGFFPAQHGVKYTLESAMTTAQYPQVQLPLPNKLSNIATVMSAAGYNVVYKGKWHLVKPKGTDYVPSDLGQYGYTRWNPQDAGANTAATEEGGGTYDNDGRFMNDDGDYLDGEEGVIAYLEKVASNQQPFCLIVSLVNPHDVLFYPKLMTSGGYTDDWTIGTIQPPATVNENLSTKPTAQQQFLALTKAGLGEITTTEMQRAYLNFYGNLMKVSDGNLVRVLDVLERKELLKNTLVVRIADHGEMGLAHGGQRQKNFNFYEESINIPLVYSNPVLYPTARSTKALVSHVDLLPTLATLFGAPKLACKRWQGVDYSSIVLNPSAPPVQDYIVFTYDDYQSGQTGPHPLPPNHIVSIRESRYKLAEYYDADFPLTKRQYEMYDLQNDPLEIKNLAHSSYVRTPAQQVEFVRLLAKLNVVKLTRLSYA